MIKNYVLLSCFSLCSVFAQNNRNITNRIAEAEMKSASKLMNLQVNPNTSNYDVTYSKLEFTVNPNFYAITGKVTHTFKALSNMTTVTFDLTNQLTVNSVKRGSTNLTFTQNTSNELVINLGTTITTGNSTTVEINYSGAPATGEQAFTKDTHNGLPIIWTLSEPFGARDWWPCKQDLNDKINSIDIYITAPKQYIAVSNGVETTTPVISGANKTTHFHHGYPIPAYLIALAVTNYRVYNQTAGISTPFPIINYIYPENYDSAVSDLSQTPGIMTLYETLFEPYPFKNEKYGHAQFGWSGGMEHTTVSFMGGFNRGLIAHEMGHQWFGDKITCGTWKDIWLNEGFATYLASLVIENFDGIDAFVIDKINMNNNITSFPSGAVYLTDSEATNVDRIFSSRLTYDKGAMVLEMLRFKMGDVAFFQALKNYLADSNLSYKYAVTADLQTHLEAVYGQPLTEFFDDWIYNQGYPTYTISAQNLGTGQVKFVVNQTQSDPSVAYFEMPVPIRVLGANGEQADLVLDNTVDGEEFIQNVAFPITSVEFDPDRHIISKNSTVTLSNQNFDINDTISIYPNPSSDVLHIQMLSTVVLEKVTVYNHLGQIVLENTNSDFNVTTLSTGVHYLDIQTSEGLFHKKFIKK